MTDNPASKPPNPDLPWVSRIVAAEPRLPLMGPYLAYLLLMMLTEFFPESLLSLSIAIHIVAAAWATWLMRHHWPSLGNPHVLLAAGAGLFAAWMWVAGQHWLGAITVAGQNLGDQLSLTSELPFLKLVPREIENIAEKYQGSAAFWPYVVLKIARAVTVVPVVEELFWRGFILRALVSWDRFDQVPWGKFTWVAFLGSSLLSVLQHPANWGLSILCWMLFNGLFYWKKSLLCLMITHAVTNLALYIYVVKAGDWQFW